MTSTSEERKEEMQRFCEKYGYDDSSKVYDHMAEKYPDVSKATHRGMFGRLKRALPKKAKTNGTAKPLSEKEKAAFKKVNDRITGIVDKATTSKRVSSNTPNVSNKPKKVKSAKALPPQKGRERIQHVDIDAKATAERQQMVIEEWNPRATQASILRKVKKVFTQPKDPATLAMIVQAIRADGDHELYAERMEKLYGHAVCPMCQKEAHGVDDIYVHFGFREANKRRQSYCRECRGKK